MDYGDGLGLVLVVEAMKFIFGSPSLIVLKKKIPILYSRWRLIFLVES